MSASSPALPSRCPTTDRLVELLDGKDGVTEGSAERAGEAEPLSRHAADCPMCSVTWARVQAGHAALGELNLPAPQPATLERLARAVLPEVARDLAPRRGGLLAVGPPRVLALVLVLILLSGALLWFLSRP